MSKDSKRINVSFSISEYNAISNIAQKKNCSLSEVVRDYTLQGLNTTITSDNLDFICKIIRDQVRDILTPSIERLASLESKTCVMATTSTYLGAEAIARFVPLSMRKDVQQAFDAARKKAVEYMTGKSDVDMEE